MWRKVSHHHWISYDFATDYVLSFCIFHGYDGGSCGDLFKLCCSHVFWLWLVTWRDWVPHHVSAYTLLLTFQWVGMCSRPTAYAQQTRGIDPKLFQCWHTIFDAGPTLKQHWVKYLVFAGWCLNAISMLNIYSNKFYYIEAFRTNIIQLHSNTSQTESATSRSLALLKGRWLTWIETHDFVSNVRS